MKNKINILFGFLFFIVLGCETMPDPKTETTPTGNMSGEWWVKTYSNSLPGSGYFKIVTYNTSANKTDSMWINDFSDNTFKTKVDINSKTFAVTGANNVALDDPNTPEQDETVKVTNGKIIPFGVTTVYKNITDSIYFEVEFSSDPGVVYVIAGYKRTQFILDDH